MSEGCERMDVGKKIQRLRQERHLTQEQFAKMLFVSRTAVSKWETGRGTPNIESLKMIAKEFDITLDELLCAEEAIEALENEHRETMERVYVRLDAMLNLSNGLMLILPLYKAESGEKFLSVPLYAFNGRYDVIFLVLPVLILLCGGTQIFMKNAKARKNVGRIILILNICAVFLFILCGQPYPAILYFIYMIIRIYMMTRKESRL